MKLDEAPAVVKRTDLIGRMDPARRGLRAGHALTSDESDTCGSQVQSRLGGRRQSHDHRIVRARE